MLFLNYGEGYWTRLSLRRKEWAKFLRQDKLVNFIKLICKSEQEMLLALIASLIVVTFILHRSFISFYHRWYSADRKSFIKGPPLNLYFGNFFDVFHKPSRFGRACYEKFGSMYQVWIFYKPMLVISNAKSIEQFYAHQFTCERPKPFGYQMEALLGDCMGLWHGPYWKQKHRIFNMLFNPKKIVPCLKESANKWLDKLDSQSFLPYHQEGIDRMILSTVASLNSVIYLYFHLQLNMKISAITSLHSRKVQLFHTCM
jgi:hypothetical protein